MFPTGRLIAMLSSTNPEVRCEACERLRLAEESSPEIVTALEKATHDKDKNVSERANIALNTKVHYQMAISMGISKPNRTDIISSLPKILNEESGGVFSMTIWEYFAVHQHRGFNAPITGGKPTNYEPYIDLKQLGNEGWELVTVIPQSSYHEEHWRGLTSNLLWIFKRPKS